MAARLGGAGWPRRLRLTVVWGLLLLLVAGAAVLGLAAASLPRTTGNLELAGLGGPVDIARDRRGVPRITAHSLHDAWFAVGVVHAQDRLFQLEMTRRIGSGRLAEAVGTAGLDTDRLMRTLGLRRLAAAQWPGLDPATRAALNAYAAGINATVAAQAASGRPLPPEFLLLGLDFAPWTPVDSLLWGRLMALRLSGDWRAEATRLALAESLPRAAVDALWPPAAAGDQAVRGLPESWVTPLASNAWAVDGRQTASGAPLLAGDPHLELALPAPWYLAVIEIPERTLAGATAPGVPFLLVGSTGDLAWSFTTTHGDTADLVAETISADGTKSVIPGGGFKSLQIHNELIAVRGAAPESLEVRESAHGPLVGAFLRLPSLPAARDYALAATALAPDDRTPDALRRLNAATTWEEAREALTLWHAPLQTVVAADRAGTIAQAVVGRVPVRRPGGEDGTNGRWPADGTNGRWPADGTNGRWPADGASGAGTWLAWHDPAALPRIEAPPEGRVVAANSRPPGPSAVVDPIGSTWPPPWRTARIAALLDTLPRPAGLADMEDIQADARSGLADALLPDLLALARPAAPAEVAAVERLRAWDRHMRPQAAEPPLFLAWVVETTRALYAPDLGAEGWARWGAYQPQILARALAETRGVAKPKTETVAAVNAGLAAATAGLAEAFGPPETWRWGDMHRAALAHPLFGRIPGLAALTGRAPATPGGPETVNRGTSALWRSDAPWPDRFRHLHGPGLRLAVDLATPAAPRVALAGGQSGHPLSPHYADWVADWAAGRAAPLWQGDDGAPRRLRLLPADISTGR